MKVRYQASGTGCLGVIDIPTTAPGVVSVSAKGVDRAEALERAAAIAARIADDPMMAVIMSGRTLDNLEMLRDLAAAAQDGPEALRDAASGLGRRGRKLVKALHIEAVKREREPEPWNTEPGARYQDAAPVDIVNGRDAAVAGFWDTVSNIATKVGTEAWKQAKAHQKEIAMAAAGAALGPAGAVAAGKAMDLVTAAQAGSPEAKKAVAQVAEKAKTGDPKARTMLAVITRTVRQDAAMARDHRAAAAPEVQPEHADDEREDPSPDIERDHGEDTGIAHDTDNGAA